MIIGPDLFTPENKNGNNKTTFNILKKNTLLDGDFYYPSNGMMQSEVPGEDFSHIQIKPIEGCATRELSGLGKIASLFSKRPFLCEPRSMIRAFYKAIENKIDDYQLILIFGLNLSDITHFLSNEQLKKVVIVPIDCLSFFYNSRIGFEDNLIKKIVWKWDQFKAKKYESQLYSKISKNLFVSPEDARFANSLSGSTNCFFIPYGVDEKSLNKGYTGNSFVTEKDQLIFTGNFNYGPNIAGAVFLAKEVLPKILARLPNVELVLAGGSPCDEVKNLASENIRVTGFVESLVGELSASRIFLSPIFFGAGVKTKVLEAMYLERVVVGTKESFFAISGEDDKDFIVVKNNFDPNSWYESIISILENSQKTKSISEAARATIIKNHTWENSREKYNDFFRRVV
jgi:glycosyltransferase involved in cell wall biosynthesis